MGRGAVAGGEALRAGIGCVYGEGVVSPKALSPLYHADLRRRGDSLAKYVNARW